MRKLIGLFVIICMAGICRSQQTIFDEDSLRMATDLEWFCEQNAYYDSILTDMAQYQEMYYTLPFSIFFDSTARIMAGQCPALDALVRIICEDTTNNQYIIYGYGECSEPDSIMFRRAAVVASYLIGSGVDLDRFVMIGKPDPVFVGPVSHRVTLVRTINK